MNHDAWAIIFVLSVCMVLLAYCDDRRPDQVELQQITTIKEK